MPDGGGVSATVVSPHNAVVVTNGAVATIGNPTQQQP